RPLEHGRGAIREGDLRPRRLVRVLRRRSPAQQLIVNLVTNAVQSASSGASGVHLRVEKRDEELHIVVEDDGPGIPDEIRARIFEPLFTTKLRAVGFGLPLCRRIAERHGGYVRASNRPEGGARMEAMLLCASGSDT